MRFTASPASHAIGRAHLLDYPVGSLSSAGGKKFDDKTGGGAKK